MLLFRVKISNYQINLSSILYSVPLSFLKLHMSVL